MNAPFDDRMDADLGDEVGTHTQDRLPSSPAEFLQALRPSGPWMVFAIDPNHEGKGKKKIVAETCSTAEAVKAFVARYEGGRNLYYSLNPVNRRMDKKAKKEDIAAVEFIGSDLDPDSGETVVAAKERYLAQLAALTCPPTFILDSGNGLNVAWRLAVPLGPEDFEKAEALSKSIMQKLGSVAGTQNTDRILRLPATTNLPTAAKIKEGRVKCQSALLSFDGASYIFSELEEFEKALPEPKVTPKGAAKDRAKSSSSKERGARDGKRRPDLDRLPIPARIKDLIRGIDDPGHHYPSRSEKVFAVLIAMISVGCSDEQVRAILLDPELPISAHVLEATNPNPSEYLEKQISKAREAAIDPYVVDLNERYAVVMVGSDVAIMKTNKDGDVVLMRYEAFKHWLADRPAVQVGKRQVPLAKYWFDHPQRRKYEGIVFAPGKEVPDHYNFWRGFAVEPRKGDCSRFLNHLRDNVCRGDEHLFLWVVGWFAWIVQRPGNKSGTSLVIIGLEGTGKSIIGKYFGSLLGKYHYLPVSKPDHVTGNFNAHQKQLLLLHVEEAIWAGSHEAEGVLKDLITGERHLIVLKYKDAISVDNHINVLITSNEKWVVPASLDARRFAVFEISEEKKEDRAYFKAMIDEMENGGREALMHYLLSFDLSQVDVQSVPKTAALLTQKMHTLKPEYRWWLDVLNSGQLPKADAVENGCSTSALYESYIEHAKKSGVQRRLSATAIGIFLREVAPGVDRREATYAGSRFVYEFPSLTECRVSFTTLVRQEIVWEKPYEWQRWSL